MKTLLKISACLILGVGLAAGLFVAAQPPDHPWMGQSPEVVEGIPERQTEPIYKTPEELEEDRRNAGPVMTDETYEPESVTPLVVFAW